MSKVTQNKQGMKILIAGSALQFFLGILYVWSVFVKPVGEAYQWRDESVRLMTSYMLSFFVVGILIGGKLQLKIGAGKVVLLGGLTLAAGMLATAFLPAGLAWFMYFTYGIAGGFGVGSAYNAIISAAQKWFPQNRGFATGVTVCAFGFSTVVFAPLIETLIGLFGVRYAFMILAAAFCIVVLALFRFIKLPDEKPMGNPGAQGVRTAAPPAGAEPAKRQYTLSETIKTKEFYLLTLSLMLATAAFFILNPSFKALAIERGLGDSAGTLVVMLTGVANALGRLGTPLLSDKIGREKSAVVIILATAACALLLSFAGGIVFMATIAVIAFCYGGFSGIYPVLTADYFGLKNVGSNYGAVMMGFALSALTFPMLIGLINNIIIKFIVLGALAAVGAFLIFLLTGSRRYRCQKNS